MTRPGTAINSHARPIPDHVGHHRTVVAGVDGCKMGAWAVAILAPDHARLIVATTTEHLWDILVQVRLALVDIPIGLPDTGPRDCDIHARRLLGPRASSVFPAPTRPLLDCTTLAHADRLQRRRTGKRVQRQMWNILPRIREIDRLLRDRPEARRVIRETHPEACFAALAGAPMLHPKRTEAGQRQRLDVISAHLPEARALLDDALAATPRSILAADDAIDALACAITARAIAADPSSAPTLPPDPPRDAHGLAMEIVLPPRRVPARAAL